MKKYNWLKIGGVAIAVLALFALLFTKGCSGSSGDILRDILAGAATDTAVRSDTIHTITIQRDTLVERDTLWQDRVVYLDRIIRPEPEIIYIYADTSTVAIHRYEGQSSDDTVKVGYVAWTVGTLDSIELNYDLLQPRVVTLRETIYETVTEEVEITKEVTRGGFFLGGGISYGYSPNTLKNDVLPSVGLGYLNRKGRFLNYSYTPVMNVHQVSARIRIF